MKLQSLVPHCILLLLALEQAATQVVSSLRRQQDEPEAKASQAATDKNRELLGRNTKTSALNYEDIPSHLLPWEEIALELVSDSVGPDSQTIPGAATTFEILRPKTEGAHIEKLSFLLEQGGILINRVGAKFTDGSIAVAGIRPKVFLRGQPVIETVKLPSGPLEDTITILPRAINSLGRSNHLVGKVIFDGLGGRQVAKSDGFQHGNNKVYDVDGRFLTGLIMVPGDVIRNLQFIVSKVITASILTDIEYDLGINAVGDAKTLDTVTLRNEGSETQTFTVSYTAVKESAISVSSERTRSIEVGFGISTTFEAKLPFVGGSETTASFETSIGSSFTSGRTDEVATSEEVTKEIQVNVPPQTLVTLQVTQFQEEIRDINFTAKHKVTFIDGSCHTSTISGTMEGVSVSNVFIKTLEESIQSDIKGIYL